MKGEPHCLLMFLLLHAYGRVSRTEHDSDQVGGRRAWNKGPGRFRLHEGPSARSLWQASKDEATLEAIRVVSGDLGVVKKPRSEGQGWESPREPYEVKAWYVPCSWMHAYVKSEFMVTLNNAKKQVAEYQAKAEMLNNEMQHFEYDYV
ncbi:hypothetical protein Cni_G20958 [Canna indica]|uniref:Uncharacterized protein n=1 Tax=Canna indica TaxID=4628 RepID=A0AAQ3QJW7_9LILI|nr:hypothetical protein Cni_G20958 [Canna indica]